MVETYFHTRVCRPGGVSSVKCQKSEVSRSTVPVSIHGANGQTGRVPGTVCYIYGIVVDIDVISVNRRMCKCTVVGTVTTFSIGRRTDVNGGAGSGFSMITHGQSCTSTG